MEVEQADLPDGHATPDPWKSDRGKKVCPDPWKYDHGKKVWVCRYTRRRSITEGDAVIYAPANWTNPRVLTELIRGYQA